MLVSIPLGGPLAVLAVLAAFDLPSGFQSAASDFTSGGGWALLAVGAVVAFGLGLVYLRGRRPLEPVGLPRDPGSVS
ncbi:MAG: hypothetical protein ACJ75S_02865 [Solirubrobacterales bacterium]